MARPPLSEISSPIVACPVKRLGTGCADTDKLIRDISIMTVVVLVIFIIIIFLLLILSESGFAGFLD
jgi:hypothetical protein